MITEILKLEADGTLKRLIKSGLVSPKVRFYMEVYLDYDKNIQTNPKGSKYQAVIDTASTFRIQESSVYRIIKTMRDE